MANILIGYDNLADTATLSGGAWNSGLPLNNLKDSRLALVARTTNATTAAATFQIDLGSVQQIRVIGLANHNITVGATIRVLAGATSGFTTSTYNSGAVNAWPVGTLASQTTYPRPSWGHALDVASRYWRIEITNTGNPAGYIQIGRLFVGPGFDPAVNYAYGAQLGYEDPTTIETSLSGAEYFGVKAKRRVMRFSLEGMTESEANDEADELVRRSGIHREVFVIPDADDTTQRHRRDFLGRLRTLSPLEQTFHDGHTMGYEIAELL